MTICLCILSLLAACGIRCYSCTPVNRRWCTDITECSFLFNRCFSMKVEVGGMFIFFPCQIYILTQQWEAGRYHCPPSCLSGSTVVTKGCQNSATCFNPMECCEGNLCNSAKMPTGSSLLLLLVSSTITMLFRRDFSTH